MKNTMIITRIPSMFFYISQQEGEFLVLPSSIKLDGTKLLLDEAFGVSSPNEAKQHINSGPSHSNESGTVLKLASQKGKFEYSVSMK